MIPIIKTEEERKIDLLLYGEDVPRWMHNGFIVGAVPRDSVPIGERWIIIGGPEPIIINKSDEKRSKT